MDALNTDGLDVSSSPENGLTVELKSSTLEAAIESLQSIVQFHFQKTVEKKKAIDSQKKQIWKLISYFFIFLSILLTGILNNTRLNCWHSWSPILLCLLGHMILYISIAQTLRCINGLKFQRHCHKLTLGLAAAKLSRLRSLRATVVTVMDCEFEVPYQEPPTSYHAKFVKRWLLHVIFLLLTFSTAVGSIITTLCL